MGKYDAVKYKRNFLKQVIVRLDFHQFMDSDLIFCDNIERVILEPFPRKEKKQIVRFNSVNVTVKTENAEVQNARGESIEGFQCQYLTSDRKNKLILSNKFIAFEINEYSSFEDVRKWIDSILSVFFPNSKPAVIRTGIRYINFFDSEKIKLQKNYFSSEIAATLVTKFLNDNKGFVPIRSMHLKEYRDDGMTLNFRFGMYNPDYPNQLRKNDFALDFDCFTEELMENDCDILRFIDVGHDAIQLFFEDSITDTLRRVLNYE